MHLVEGVKGHETVKDRLPQRRDHVLAHGEQEAGVREHDDAGASA